MNKYPAWKYGLLLLILILGLIYALPTLYGEIPSVQISSQTAGVSLSSDDMTELKQALLTKKLNYQAIKQEGKSILVLCHSIDEQQAIQDYLKILYSNRYLVAISFAPNAPAWLAWVGANPIHLGLDLRGGVHLLLQVDMDTVEKRRLESDVHNIADSLRDARIHYSGILLQKPASIALSFQDKSALEQADDFLSIHFPDYQWRSSDLTLVGLLNPQATLGTMQDAIAKTMETLNRRINALGVSEATVQQQGADRISVDMPGVQDATQAQNILGKTATLEFHLVDTEHDPMVAAQGVAPPGSQLYFYNGQPVLLKDQVVLSGDAISDASAGFDENGRPAVDIRMAGQGESNFYHITGQNIGKPLAVVYIETKLTPIMVNGKEQIISKEEKQVINIATIQGALGSPFQIMGLSSTDEAKNLSLLLRAGALVAPVVIIAESNVGPSMGAQNIHAGLLSVLVGIVLVAVFMIFYYNVFGLFANIALCLNLVFTVAIMSLLGAVLSFPGIAAMVLTLATAVDACVLIFERIREELRLGVTAQVAINAGYEKAFATIVDANVTTLIAAVVLFSIGTGPIKGFAVTLIIGILTSMFTAIAYTRAIVNLSFGGKKITRLPIGMKK